MASPDVIVTACPLCLNTFGRYADRKVEDLAETVDRNASSAIPGSLHLG